MRRHTIAFTLSLAVAVSLSGCSLFGPRTAQDVVARSLKAHGGDALTGWKTLTIAGTIEMEDGITYRAAYRLFAEAPGKLRVEHDMTADRGRQFHEYFLNDGVAWNRRNLIPSRGDARRLQRWMDQTMGIAYYARHAKTLELKPEAQVAWRVRDGEGRYNAGEARPAYVVHAVMEGWEADLYIDKETFHFLQESLPAAPAVPATATSPAVPASPETTRVFHDFKAFDGAVFPTRILEITKNRQGRENVTPITFESVAHDQSIEGWMFTEDMPERR